MEDTKAKKLNTEKIAQDILEDFKALFPRFYFTNVLGRGSYGLVGEVSD